MKGAYVRAPKLRPSEGTPHIADRMLGNNVKMVPYDIPMPALSIHIFCGSSIVKIMTRLLMTSNAVGTDMNATLLMKW